MSPTLNVLLMSPLAGLDPICGDIIYTEQLLQNPPAGVKYQTYAEAMEQGNLVEISVRNNFAKAPLLSLANSALKIGRRLGFLYVEPFRFLSLKAGVFDLVHMHVFNARFSHLDCPLVLSSGAPQSELYKYRRNYSDLSIEFADFVDRIVAKAMGVNCFSHLRPQAERSIVYTQQFKDHLVAKGYAQDSKIDVIPLFVDIDKPKAVERKPYKIGFVALNFEEKGGRTLLAAYDIVRQHRSDCELLIIGSKPQLSNSELESKKITWLDRLPRDILVNELYPSMDVFAYPTPHDCFSYVLVEAMAEGKAIATSDYNSMPEAIDFGRAGLSSAVGDAGGLAKNLIFLLDESHNKTYGEAARKRYEEYFSREQVLPKIEDCYRQAVNSYRLRNGMESQSLAK
jgi:glycosyltransferase involved in cell wall biosynthesis